MPANLTPDYLAAEARFKAERDPKKRIEALEEMLAVIPKHKGTEHLRGDLKKKLSQLREEAGAGGAKKGKGRRVSPGYVPAQGAGQVVLLGPTNTGKSALVRALTRAEPEVAPYPYTTRKPLPAMMMYQDAPIQLVDAPALDRAVYESWMNMLARNADLGLIVLDPAAPEALGAVDEIQELLGSGRLKIAPAWWAMGEAKANAAGREELAGKELGDAELMARLEPSEEELPIIIAANKIDSGDNREQFEVLKELIGKSWPIIPVSARSGEGLDRLREALFRGLRVIRVYAKPPGKPPSTKEPVILPQGSTVRDMARHIHKELEAKLRFARIWSERYHDGQRVPRDAELMDRDIVELNA